MSMIINHPAYLTSGTPAYAARCRLLGGCPIVHDAAGNQHRHVCSCDPFTGEILANAICREHPSVREQFVGTRLYELRDFRIPEGAGDVQLIAKPGSITQLLYKAPAPLRLTVQPMDPGTKWRRWPAPYPGPPSWHRPLRLAWWRARYIWHLLTLPFRPAVL